MGCSPSCTIASKQSVQKVDEANVQLCRKCQQHLSPATISTLTSSHNATVQRLNDRVASANDALLKQQATHAEKDEALEQARLQLQQLQISTNGLKGKARVLDIVSRELGARCEALGLEELPSVDLATWQSCVDTNNLPDHCIAMCRTLLQQVKALDLARDIALEVRLPWSSMWCLPKMLPTGAVTPAAKGRRGTGGTQTSRGGTCPGRGAGRGSVRVGGLTQHLWCFTAPSTQGRGIAACQHADPGARNGARHAAARAGTVCT